MRSFWPLLSAAATFFSSTAKSAEPPAVGALTVHDEGASCASSASLEQRVDRLLGASGETRERMQAAGIGATVWFMTVSGGYRADIELHGARSGRRTLSDYGTDCRELADAAALTLALLIDPSFVPPSGRGSAGPPRDRSAGGSAPATPPPGTPPAPASALSLNAEGGATAGLARRPVLPHASSPAESTSASLFAGAGMASRLTRPLVLALSGGTAFDFSSSLGIRALALWVPTSSVEIGPGRVELGLLLGSLEACAHFPVQTGGFRVSACGGMSAGSISAAGKGYPVNMSTRQAFYAFQAGFSGEVSAGRPLGLWLDARGYVPVTNYEFDVPAAGSVKPTKVPGFSALIGLRVRLF